MSFTQFPITLPSIPNPERSPQEFILLYSTLGSLDTPLSWLQARLSIHNPACTHYASFVEYMDEIIPQLNPEMQPSDMNFEEIKHNLTHQESLRPQRESEPDSAESTLITEINPKISTIEEIFTTVFHDSKINDTPIFITGISSVTAELISLAILAYLHKIDLIKAMGFPRINSLGLYDDQHWMRIISQIQVLQRSLARHNSAGKLKLNPLPLFSAWPELSRITAQYINAASLAKPCIVSDLVSLLAITLAEEIAPGVRNWCLLGGKSPYPIYELSAKQLFLEVHLDITLDLLPPESAILFTRILHAALRSHYTDHKNR